MHPSQLLPRRHSFRSTARAACVAPRRAAPRCSGICAADSRVREVAAGGRMPNVAARDVATRVTERRAVSLRLSRVATPPLLRSAATTTLPLYVHDRTINDTTVQHPEDCQHSLLLRSRSINRCHVRSNRGNKSETFSGGLF